MQARMTDRPPELPLILIGPTAVGKSTVARILVEEALVHITPTWTTRPLRADEAQGSIDHVFVSESEFADLERKKFFIATARAFNLPFLNFTGTVFQEENRKVDKK